MAILTMVDAKSLREFWKGLPADADVHPADEPTLRSQTHQLQPDVKPGPWYFNLEGASIYLLRGNPGFVAAPDIEHERRGGGLWDLSTRKYAGEDVEEEMISYTRTHGLNCDEWVWKFFRGTIHSDQELIERTCFLNIVAYRATEFKFAVPFRNMPSSNLIRKFLHDDILPRARSGEIMLIRLMGDREWGISQESSSDTILKVSRGQKFKPGAKYGYDKIVREFLDRACHKNGAVKRLSKERA